MRLLTIGLVLLLLVGCATVPKPKPGTPEWDAMATRAYAAPPDRVLAAAAQVYTTLGIEITQSDSGLGMLKGARTDMPLAGTFGKINKTYQILVSPTDTGSRVSLMIFLITGGTNKQWDFPPDYAAVFDPLGASLGRP